MTRAEKHGRRLPVGEESANVAKRTEEMRPGTDYSGALLAAGFAQLHVIDSCHSPRASS